jgi:hypothetical protein
MSETRAFAPSRQPTTLQYGKYDSPLSETIKQRVIFVTAGGACGVICELSRMLKEADIPPSNVNTAPHFQ